MREKMGLGLDTGLLRDIQVLEDIGVLEDILLEQEDIQVLEQEDNRMLELDILGPQRDIQQWLEGTHIVQTNAKAEQRLAAGGSSPLTVEERRGSWLLKEAQDHSLHQRCEAEPSRTS